MNLLSWLHLPAFLFLVYLLWRTVGKGPGLKPVFWTALLLKLGCGVALGWLYQHYLNIGPNWHQMGDTWSYHAEALKVVTAAKENPAWYLKFLWQNDVSEVKLLWKVYSNSFFFLKPLSGLYLLTGNSYWGSGLYLSLFSFWGSWFLVGQLRTYFPAYGLAAAVAFLFFPSTVFWASGVLKDALFMGSLCLTVGLFLKLYKTESSAESGKYILFLLPCVWLLWRIKFFLAAVLVVLLGTYVLTKWLAERVEGLRSRHRQLLVWLGLLGGGAFAASFAHPTFNLGFFARHILWNYRNILEKTDLSKPHLSFPDLQATLGSVLLHAPEAVGQMLSRPFLWEVGPLSYQAMGLENLLLFLLVLLCLLERIKERKLPPLPSFLAVLLVFFCVAGVLVTLPTPNLGSLHRYRAPLLPFFLTVIIAWGPLPAWGRKLANRWG
ncbi:hypothetical protein EFA69_09015 [Rufibacter immobilis]|uniref:Glycosyltransferase RgtA/B/C/D-like domain-containing protein n=1 Tax=Rufibacter immobilis TaxID=1348778 RepID=A0A3M9MY50_9BACT|nr:hypothetical protein [Rufibacter immobilis]RNI29688.1 hypothetical protein EFA69_09015 [Rufibacter immobilis]